jgi:hypothetical protein
MSTGTPSEGHSGNGVSPAVSSSSTPVAAEPSTKAATKYYRRVIRIRAEDSPNVQYALAEIAAGLEPSNTVLIPGLLTWQEYKRRRKVWDKRRQTIGLDAQFYEGEEILMWPAPWLAHSIQLAERLKREGIKRRAKIIACDPGEGEADTSISVIDELGLIKLRCWKTPDTSVIKGEMISLGTRFGVRPERWWFDRGGGGKQIADDMRRQGYNVNTVAFGEAATPPPGKTFDAEELKDKEEGRTTYRNRRIEMYDTLSQACNPTVEVPGTPAGFAIAYETDEEKELHRQLGLIPRMWDGNGVMYLPPKTRKDKNSTEVTMTEIVGRSPDHADSLVIARWAQGRPDRRPVVGVL